MQGYFAFGGIGAWPGDKATGFFPVPGTSIAMPLTVINGVAPGPTLLVTAGIHGGEYPSIEAAMRFAAELVPTAVSGQVVVIPLVAPSAFLARQEYTLPEDGKNLNRQFPGNPTGTVSERMAFALMNEAAATASAWVDLHGGDIHEALVPIGGYESDAAPSVYAQARAMIEVFGVEYAAQTYNLPGTALHTATTAGIPSILAEAGQQGRCDAADTLLLLQGCRNVARLLGLLPGGHLPGARPQMLERIDWVRAEHRGCWYPAVTLRERIEQGHIIGRIKDYFGNIVAEYRAPHSGIVVLSCTSLAVREQHTLVGVGIPPEPRPV